MIGIRVGVSFCGELLFVVCRIGSDMRNIQRKNPQNVDVQNNSTQVLPRGFEDLTTFRCNSRNIQNKKSSKHGFVSIPRDSSTSNTMESEIPRIESSNRKGSCEDPQNLNASSTHWYTSTHHSRASITNIQTKHNTTWQQQQS